jgi:1,2-diacylglycerol 3-alpha-glucosyltransferase
MKVAMLTDTYSGIGGTEQAIKNSVSVLKELGCEVEILYSEKHYKLRRPLSVLLKFEPDVVHIHTPGPLGHIGVLYGKAKEIPVVGYFHSLPDVRFYFEKELEKKTLGEFLWRLVKYFYKGCDLILVPTREVEGLLLSKGFDEEKLQVIRYGVDLEKFCPGEGDDALRSSFCAGDGDFLLLYAGWFRKDKRVDVLVEMMGELPITHNLLLVGGGHKEKNIKKKVEKEGLGDRVHFHSPVANHELPKYYRTCDVYVNAAVSETMGISMMEAMACGKPVVASPSPGANEIIIGDHNGYLAASNSPESLAQSVLLLDETRARRLGANARRTAVERFDVWEMGRRLMEAYENALSF